MKETPPKGVSAPHHLLLVSVSMYRDPENTTIPPMKQPAAEGEKRGASAVASRACARLAPPNCAVEAVPGSASCDRARRSPSSGAVSERQTQPRPHLQALGIETAVLERVGAERAERDARCGGEAGEAQAEWPVCGRARGSAGRQRRRARRARTELHAGRVALYKYVTRCRKHRRFAPAFPAARDVCPLAPGSHPAPRPRPPPRWARGQRRTCCSAPSRQARWGSGAPLVSCSRSRRWLASRAAK